MIKRMKRVRLLFVAGVELLVVGATMVFTVGVLLFESGILADGSGGTGHITRAELLLLDTGVMLLVVGGVALIAWVIARRGSGEQVSALD